MLRRELPRVYELIDQINADPLKAHFNDFERSLADEPSMKPALVCLEKELQQIDIIIWDQFKKEVEQLSSWRELMDRMNELKGYLYLMSLGCEDIKRVPRGKARTPDWRATCKGGKVICEIKTINTSDAEMEFRKGKEVRCPNSITGTSWTLSDGCLNQIAEKIGDAEKQLKAFDASNETRRIAFIIIHFDDFLRGQPGYYFQQIGEFLRRNPVLGIRVVCYGKTMFGEGYVSFDWHESTPSEPVIRIESGDSCYTKLLLLKGVLATAL